MALTVKATEYLQALEAYRDEPGQDPPHEQLMLLNVLLGAAILHELSAIRTVVTLEVMSDLNRGRQLSDDQKAQIDGFLAET